MVFLILAIVALLAPSGVGGQGVTLIDTVPAPSLAANLVGDPAWRQVSVYLPPDYARVPQRRYPVVYWLHGFGSTDRELISGIRQNLNIRLAMDSLIRAGAARGMIIVMPNANNAFAGSFYVNSPVTGRWEDFVVDDLVRWVDRKYRTVRSRSGRGIAGFSMGGYGALRIAMRRSDKFSAVYAMSPCCLDAEAFFARQYAAAWSAAGAVKSREDLSRAPFHAQLLLAMASIYSPDTTHSPLYLRMPMVLEGNPLITDPETRELWSMDPLSMVPNSGRSFQRLAIALDAGAQDGFPDIPINVRWLDSTLTAMGIRHQAEIYQGTHGNLVRERITKQVLPFFSRELFRGRIAP